MRPFTGSYSWAGCLAAAIIMASTGLSPIVTTSSSASPLFLKGLCLVGARF